MSQKHARYTEQTARREQVDVIKLQRQHPIDEMNGSKKTGKSVQ
jgi:hypothetical protein